MGYAVAILADSTSRWAEALRELGSQLEEMPGEEGYPPYLSARLASYYERAGLVTALSPEGREGSVTVVSAVSPPGGDFSEPVTQASLRVAGALWALDGALAERRHFPAVSWTESYSLYVGELGDWFGGQVSPEWSAVRLRAMALLQKERELEQIVQVVGAEALPDEERLVLRAARLVRETFLQQNGFDPVDASTPPERQFSMLQALLRFYDRSRAALERGAALEEILESELWAKLARMRQIPGERFASEMAELENRFSRFGSEAEGRA
jgi:V/A-type H+-transporting ATPase subunit A